MTSSRVSVLIVIVFVILLSSVAPLYVVNKLGLKFFPGRNKTLLGLVLTSDREKVERASFAINNVFIPFSAFIVVSVCTVTLVVTIRKRSAWRVKSTTATQADNITSKNQRVAKMVVVISALFIACFVPISALFVAMVIEPELSIDGTYRNTLIVVGGLGFVLESINSSVNIFIYYHMSSKYRCIFHQIFHFSRNKETGSGTN